MYVSMFVCLFNCLFVCSLTPHTHTHLCTGIPDSDNRERLHFLNMDEDEETEYEAEDRLWRRFMQANVQWVINKGQKEVIDALEAQTQQELDTAQSNVVTRRNEGIWSSSELVKEAVRVCSEVQEQEMRLRIEVRRDFFEALKGMFLCLYVFLPPPHTHTHTHR